MNLMGNIHTARKNTIPRSTPTTLYAYVNGDGSVKEPGQRLLDGSIDKKAASLAALSSGKQAKPRNPA